MMSVLSQVFAYAAETRRGRRMRRLLLCLWPLRRLYRGAGVSSRIQDFTYTLY